MTRARQRGQKLREGLAKTVDFLSHPFESIVRGEEDGIESALRRLRCPSPQELLAWLSHNSLRCVGHLFVCCLQLSLRSFFLYAYVDIYLIAIFFFFSFYIFFLFLLFFLIFLYENISRMERFPFFK